ncbi:MAG: DUF2029 domain-containing protein [Planctomycetia bacterium]|nr:DUF2029 domain-containing protein [Planctomycetia bacterium]
MADPPANLTRKGGGDVTHRPGGRGSPELLAAILLTAVAVILALAPPLMPDFFIFRLGSLLAARGENPYDLEKIRAHVGEQFPDNKGLKANCGYFLPPQAVVLFLPFAMLPWPVAKIAWALLMGAAGFAIAQLPRLLRRPTDSLEPSSSLTTKLVPFLLLLNFLTIAVVMVGQFSVLFVGCVAAGLWCFERGGRFALLGVLLWSVPFVKPHVALPLIPLAWYLYGWKRAVGVLVVVGLLNVLGATIVGGSPMFLRDYFAHLSSTFKAVDFNRAALNYEMLSWNRLLYVLTQPHFGERFLIEQNAITAVASYLVWFGLVIGRCAIANVLPSAAWATAATAAAATFCPQVLGYEALVLMLAVPWVRELFTDGRRSWAWIVVALLALQVVPYQTFSQIGFHFHRPLGVALFALVVLCGPLGTKKAS